MRNNEEELHRQRDCGKARHGLVKSHHVNNALILTSRLSDKLGSATRLEVLMLR